MSPSPQCILYILSVPLPLFYTRQKGVQHGAFLNFGKKFVRKEEAERLLRRDFPEGDELQHNFAQVNTGALLLGISRIRHVMLRRDEKVFLLLNPYRCIIFQLAFLTLRVLLVIQHAHMLVKILRVWKIEVDHIGAALRPNGIVVRILYAQHLE